MLVSLKNLGPLTELDLDLRPGGHVLAGPNGAGKSTLCHALAHLLTGDAKLARTNAEIEKWITQGAKNGRVIASDERGRVGCRWPDPDLRIEDDPPRASPVATGMVKPARLPAKERAALLIEALKALPTKPEWLKALIKAGESEEAALKLWEAIESQGWDGAVDTWTKRGREKKGAWKQVTNSPGYPSKGAEKWQTPGFDQDLTGLSLKECEEAVAALRTQRDLAIQQSGRAAQKREEMELRATQLGAWKADVVKAEAQLNSAEAAHEAASRRLAKLKPAETEGRCPHCNQPVVVDGAQLRKPAPGPKVDPLTYEEARRAVTDKLRELRQAESLLQANRNEVTKAENAAAELKNLPAVSESADLQAHDDELADAVALAAAVRQTAEAYRIHREIVTLTIAIDRAGPTGLRLTKLSTLLDAMNRDLAAMCETAGWPKVEIAPDLKISADGFDTILAASWQWRIDALLALYFASHDGSALAILDGADILDAAGRNGLVTLLATIEIPVLITMTLTQALARKIAGTIPTTWLAVDDYGLSRGGPLAAEDKVAA